MVFFACSCKLQASLERGGGGGASANYRVLDKWSILRVVCHGLSLLNYKYNDIVCNQSSAHVLKRDCKRKLREPFLPTYFVK